MSEERTVTDVASGREISMSESLALDPEEIQRLRREKKARLASVLERGVVADRLNVELPPDKWGQWVPNDQAEIVRLQALGFWIDEKYATARALHNQGSQLGSVVGDTIFMVCDKETKEILDEIRQESYESINGKPGATIKSQKEEKEFAASTQRQGLPVVEESASRAARKAELEAALLKSAEARADAAGGHVVPQGTTPAVNRPQQPKPKGTIIR